MRYAIGNRIKSSGYYGTIKSAVWFDLAKTWRYTMQPEPTHRVVRGLAVKNDSIFDAREFAALEHQIARVEEVS